MKNYYSVIMVMILFTIPCTCFGYHFVVKDGNGSASIKIEKAPWEKVGSGSSSYQVLPKVNNKKGKLIRMTQKPCRGCIGIIENWNVRSQRDAIPLRNHGLSHSE